MGAQMRVATATSTTTSDGWQYKYKQHREDQHDGNEAEGNGDETSGFGLLLVAAEVVAEVVRSAQVLGRRRQRRGGESIGNVTVTSLDGVVVDAQMGKIE